MPSETGAKALVNRKLDRSAEALRHPKAAGAKAPVRPDCLRGPKCPLFHGAAKAYFPLRLTGSLPSPRTVLTESTQCCRSPRGTFHQTEPGNGHRTANPSPNWRTEPHWRGGAGFTSTVASAPVFTLTAPPFPEAFTALWDANSTPVCWGCQDTSPTYCRLKP